MQPMYLLFRRGFFKIYEIIISKMIIFVINFKEVLSNDNSFR